MSGAKISKQIHNDDRSSYFAHPTQQYLNLTKTDIKLIWGNKQGAFLRHVPDNFCPPDTKGYALLRGFNCQARCEYCFLQDYFRSPDMVKFTHIEAYFPFLEKFIKAFKSKYGESQRLVLYDGDFHDSLGYVGLKEDIQQINLLTNFLGQYEHVFLEIKTKCILELPKHLQGGYVSGNPIQEIAIPPFSRNTYRTSSSARNDDCSSFFDRFYKNLEIRPSLLTAITFSPQEVIDLYEPGTASLQTRLAFAQYISKRGGLIGPRIDPIIMDRKEREGQYDALITDIKSSLDESVIYSRWIGTLRLKHKLYTQLKKHDSSMISGLEKATDFWKYPESQRRKLYERYTQQIGSDHCSVCMDIF